MKTCIKLYWSLFKLAAIIPSIYFILLDSETHSVTKVFKTLHTTSYISVSQPRIHGRLLVLVVIAGVRGGQGLPN